MSLLALAIAAGALIAAADQSRDADRAAIEKLQQQEVARSWRPIVGTEEASERRMEGLR